jgi:ADP-ribosylglycohydrolase
VRSLEAALWALHTTTGFEEGCLRAVNLGDDADTTAAVYGQLAGAIHGEEGIPQAWRERLAYADLVRGLADRLLSAQRSPASHRFAPGITSRSGSADGYQ